MDSRTEALKQIKDEVVNLVTSPLYAERIANKAFPVIGDGSHTAHIMFVGEAPGKNEAATGRPFCGAAGKFLNEMLGSIGLTREEVYVTNIVKDRPTDNRDPLPEEIEIYGPFLNRQVEIIQPRVIATLGRFSMSYIMKQFGLEQELKPISQIHGQVFTTTVSYGSLTIIPLYHPAAALYNGSMREVLKKDFQILTQFTQ